MDTCPRLFELHALPCPACHGYDRGEEQAKGVAQRCHRPLAEFLRLRALEATASEQALEDAEDAADAQDWLAREARGETTYVPLPEVRRRLGLAG